MYDGVPCWECAVGCGAALRQAHLDGVAFVLQELPNDVLHVLVAPGNLLLQRHAEILLDVPVHTAGNRALSERQKIISKLLSYDLGDI